MHEKLEGVVEVVLEGVMDELRGRRGFRHLLEKIEIEDPETYQELTEALKQQIRQALDDRLVVILWEEGERNVDQ